MWQCGGELCPDIVSYNTVIKACGNAAQIDMGFKVREALFKCELRSTVALPVLGCQKVLSREPLQEERRDTQYKLQAHVICMIGSAFLIFVVCAQRLRNAYSQAHYVGMSYSKSISSKTSILLHCNAACLQVYHVMTMRGIEPTVATFGECSP